MFSADRCLVFPFLTAISAGKVWIGTACSHAEISESAIYLDRKRRCKMKVADHLSKNTKQQLKSIKPKKRKPEQLSRKDIEELMGCNRDTYTRRNGAVRRK